MATGTAIFAFRLREAVFGPGSLFRGYDGAIQSYPWLTKVIHGWRSFAPSLWDFSTFSGTSFVGELQTGVFYPLTAIWAWIAPATPKGLDAFVVFHHGLAFAFMALLCRRLGLSIPASFLAALAFSSYLDWSQPNRMFGMAFLPLLIHCFERALERPERVCNPWLFAGGAALACAFLAGHHQPPIHSAFCLAVFAAVGFGGGRRWGRRLWTLAAMGTAALLLSAPQLWFSLQYLQNAYRWTPVRIPALSSVSYRQYGFENTLNPELFVYFAASWIPVAAVAAVALLFADRSPERKRLAWYGLLVAAFCWSASFGDASWVGRLTWYVPGLNLVRETERFLFPFLFAAALLLAVSLDGLGGVLARRWPGWRGWTVAPLTIVAGVGLWWHSSLFLYVQPPEDPLSPARLYPYPSPADGAETAAALRFLLDRAARDGGQCRVLNFEDALAPNLGNVYPIHTTSGHRATMYAPYFDYLAGSLGDPKAEAFDRLGACYAVSAKPLDLPALWRGENLSVYRRPQALPVFRVEDPVTGAATAVEARIDWGGNRVDLELERPVEGRLVFAQIDYPGWRVRVDGKARRATVSGPFLAVDLVRGDRLVSFVYRPAGLFWSLGAVVATLIAWLLVGALPSRGAGERPQPALLKN